MGWVCVAPGGLVRRRSVGQLPFLAGPSGYSPSCAPPLRCLGRREGRGLPAAGACRFPSLPALFHDSGTYRLQDSPLVPRLAAFHLRDKQRLCATSGSLRPVSVDFIGRLVTGDLPVSCFGGVRTRIVLRGGSGPRCLKAEGWFSSVPHYERTFGSHGGTRRAKFPFRKLFTSICSSESHIPLILGTRHSQNPCGSSFEHRPQSLPSIRVSPSYPTESLRALLCRETGHGRRFTRSTVPGINETRVPRVFHRSRHT